MDTRVNDLQDELSSLQNRYNQLEDKYNEDTKNLTQYFYLNIIKLEKLMIFKVNIIMK